MNQFCQDGIKSLIESTFQGIIDLKGKQQKFFFLSLQVPPVQLFSKETIAQANLEIPYKFIKLPKYLVLHFKRFTKNDFFLEKNPTIVNFPLEGLEVQDAKYDLVANIIHDGKVDSGTYRIQVRQEEEKWLEIQDLYVSNVLAQ